VSTVALEIEIAVASILEPFGARDARATVAVDATGLTHFRLTAASLVAFGTALEDFKLECRPDARLRPDHPLHCSNGQLSFRDRENREFRQELDLSLSANLEHLRLHLRDRNSTTPTLNLEIDQPPGGGWKVALALPSLEAAQLLQRVPPDFSAQLPAERWPATATGRLGFTATLTGQGEVIERGELELTLAQLGFTALDASEALDATLSLRGKPTGTGWSGQASYRQSAGSLYLVPGFKVSNELTPGWLITAPPEAPVTAGFDWNHQAATELLEVANFHFSHPGVVTVTGGCTMTLGPELALQTLTAALAPTALAPLYDHYLKPLLSGTALDALASSGEVAASVHLAGQQLIDAELELRGVGLEDQAGRYGIAGLTGGLALGPRHAGDRRSLDFQSAHLYRLPIAASSFRLLTEADSLRLAEPGQMPILDGALEVEQLALTLGADRAPELQLSGVLTPISLEALSQTLDWPSVSGRVSGVIPDVRWQDGRVVVAGDLLLKVFDGRVIARGLEVQGLLGTLPALSTDLDIEGLDLELATRNSSFGLIRGRISGQVKDLRLQNWEPVAMDLKLGTPAGDDRPHRISQRAVNSLSALSGGAPNLLSRGLMRIFSDYGYGRLGVRCRLQNGLCEMGGVSETDDRGMVLVSRGGLRPPWIEVRASGQRIAWATLKDIFKRIRSGELIIE
jgi:hypothetical protein